MKSITIYKSETSIERFLYKGFIGKSYPTLIIVVGIHGNELAGVYAAINILNTFKKEKLSPRVNLYIIAGNMNAISKGIRHETIDLNRLWSNQQLNKIKRDTVELNADEQEQKEIYFILKDIFKIHTGPFYLVDLHTASAATDPFIMISDSINNRLFSNRFDVPVIIGVEEYIRGPLLTFINEYGYIGIGFEAGQHHDKKSVEYSESFLWRVLKEVGCLKKSEIPNYREHVKRLADISNYNHVFFTILYKHSIAKNEKFKMLEGFKNFQKIRKNQHLAMSNDTELYSISDGRIFLPLYQKQGNDGYFIIKKTSGLWLSLSRFVRTFKLYFVLGFLPGIRISKIRKYTLQTNPDTTTSFSKRMIRLFGYREHYQENGYHFYRRRDRKIKTLA